MDIKIFTTGGSIDKVYDTQTSDFVVGEPQIKNILAEANLTLDYEIEALMAKDSLELNDQDRNLIFARTKAAPHRHILITHGTDTMIATARQLSKIKNKVIVLTGAMQPAAFKRTDAAFNVGCAIIALQTLPEGVYVVMNGRIFDPQKTIKNVELDQFQES